MQIDPEKIMEQAAQRLADEAWGEFDPAAMLRAELSRRIDAFLGPKAKEMMEEVLRGQIEGIMTREIVPINTWGEQDGKPFTLRDEMLRRAAEFWAVKVDKDGKETTYGGKPRHQHMFEQIAKEQFAEAIRANIEAVIAGFREALRKDAGVMLGEHIERFIKAPKRQG